MLSSGPSLSILPDRTERTYVKGLQELVDIYIRPASATVNVLSGVGQSKDTVVPSQERKIVFGGIEALFVFHLLAQLHTLPNSVTQDEREFKNKGNCVPRFRKC